MPSVHGDLEGATGRKVGRPLIHDASRQRHADWRNGASEMDERNSGALTRLIGGQIIITDGQYHACVTRCHEMSDERGVKVQPSRMSEWSRFIITLPRFVVTLCTIVAMTMRNIDAFNSSSPCRAPCPLGALLAKREGKGGWWTILISSRHNSPANPLPPPPARFT